MCNAYFWFEVYEYKDNKKTEKFVGKAEFVI